MNRLLFVLLAITLTAQPPSDLRGTQIWEEGRSVLTTQDSNFVLSTIRNGRSSLLALDRDGVRRELRHPEALRRPILTHWKGRSFAYGFPPHPTWSYPDFGKRVWSYPHQAFADAYQRSEHHLFRSTDFQTWHLLGRYRPDEDTHGKIRELFPLEDGSFLAMAFSVFWVNDRASLCARYRLDARGHLMFESLIELGAGGIYDTIPHPTRPGQKAIQARPGYEGIGRYGWLTARTPEGLVLIDRAGWYFVLDNRDGHCLREGRIKAPEGKTLWILDAQPGPDGRILMASTQLRGKNLASLSPFGKPEDKPSERLARQMMWFKSGARFGNDLEGPTPLTWQWLDPITGFLRQELSPRGVPTLVADQQTRWSFCFTIQPDGNLNIFQGLNERPWWGL